MTVPQTAINLNFYFKYYVIIIKYNYICLKIEALTHSFLQFQNMSSYL
jgi:hypothetical protein